MVENNNEKPLYSLTIAEYIELNKKLFSELNKKDNHTINDENIFLTISEASKYTNLAKQTLYGLTSKRGIPFIKRSKKIYFKKSDLEKWLLEGRKYTKNEIENNSKL